MCSGEESFEAGPSFLLCREIFPGFSLINEETGLLENLEGDANYLFEAVWSVAGGGLVDTIWAQSMTRRSLSHRYGNVGINTVTSLSPSIPRSFAS